MFFFQVEKLSVATVEHHFMNSYDLFSDTAALASTLQMTDTVLYWAPLSSLTDQQWQEYSESETGKGLSLVTVRKFPAGAWQCWMSDAGLHTGLRQDS